MAQGTGKSIHANHRFRMRQRVRENGLESLQEHEALEYLLFYAIPRKDTNELAHRLIQHFGSFCRVLEASEEELQKVEGIGPSTANFLHMLLEAWRYYALHKRDIRKPLKTCGDCLEYVRPLFMGYQDELFFLVALDSECHPLRTILISKGLPNKVSFDSQAVARSAVAVHCTQVLLAHNHPSGPAMPSIADQETTDYLAGFLGPLGIDIYDHIIVTPTDWLSFKQTGRIPRYNALSQKITY